MKTVVCFGDSNTHGYNPIDRKRYERDVRWTGIVQKLLGEDYYVVEEGCNGRTTVFVNPKEPWKTGEGYLKACLNTHKPIDIFVMMLGSNDMKKMFHASPIEIADGAEKLVKMTIDFLEEKQGYAPKILLISPPHLREGIGKGPFRRSFSESAVIVSKHLREHYEKVAVKYGCYFLDASKIVKSSELDQLHLMPEDHQLLAYAIAEILLKMDKDKR